MVLHLHCVHEHAFQFGSKFSRPPLQKWAFFSSMLAVNALLHYQHVLLYSNLAIKMHDTCTDDAKCEQQNWMMYKNVFHEPHYFKDDCANPHRTAITPAHPTAVHPTEGGHSGHLPPKEDECGVEAKAQCRAVATGKVPPPNGHWDVDEGPCKQHRWQAGRAPCSHDAAMLAPRHKVTRSPKSLAVLGRTQQGDSSSDAAMLALKAEHRRK